jgi:hypothetical protein
VAEQGPLEKPAHLRPAGGGSWLAQRPAAAVALALGVVAFLAALIAQGELTSSPDPRLTVPGFGVTAAAAIVSLVRRERGAYWAWGLGVGLAGAAIVLGWFLMLAIVAGATAAAILILHTVM